MRLVELDASGRVLVDSLLPRIHQAERRLMACVSGPEQRRLLDSLGRLQAATAGMRL